MENKDVDPRTKVDANMTVLLGVFSAICQALTEQQRQQISASLCGLGSWLIETAKDEKARRTGVMLLTFAQVPTGKADFADAISEFIEASRSVNSAPCSKHPAEG